MSNKHCNLVLGNIWDALDYPLEIRRIIYTTNVIESLTSHIRRFSNAKYQFPDDQSAPYFGIISFCNVKVRRAIPQ